MTWIYAVPGIPDDEFERVEGIPMTKEEIRVLALSKARIRRGGTFLDVGSGTGSVSVEAALMMGPGSKVFAIDRDPRAVELTRRNAARFGVLDRIEIIFGEAPEAINEVPDNLDSAFVGGGSERIGEIIKAIVPKLRSGGRIVVDAILVETVAKTVQTMSELGLRTEVVEVIVARGVRTRMGTAMMSRNPIFIIVGEKP